MHGNEKYIAELTEEMRKKREASIEYRFKKLQDFVYEVISDRLLIVEKKIERMEKCK